MLPDRECERRGINEYRKNTRTGKVMKICKHANKLEYPYIDTYYCGNIKNTELRGITIEAYCSSPETCKHYRKKEEK